MQRSLPYVAGGMTGWFQRQLPLQDRPYLQGLMLMLIYAAAFIPAFTMFDNSPLRFITYAVPFANLMVWFMLSPRQLHYDTRFVISLAMYTLLMMTSATLTLDVIDSYTWINALRPVFYLLMFVPFMTFNLNSLRFLVMIVAITMVLQAIFGTTTSSGDFNFAESKGLLESGLAFPLGAMLLFCLRYRRTYTTVLVTLLFLAAFKRVAIAAVILVFAWMLLNLIISKLTGIREKWLATATALLMLVFAVLLNLYYYEFFSFVADLMGMKQSVVTLTMGRTSEFSILDLQTGSQPLLNILFGGGPGFATRNLVEVTITYPLQVHNSYLLYYYDYGVIGFTWMLLGFFVIYSRNTLGLYLFAYNIFVMITDNSFTHHYQQFICFVLIGIAEWMERHKKEKSAHKNAPA